MPLLAARPLAAALDRAAARVSLKLQATAVRKLWETVVQARVDHACREENERRARQLRESARAAEAKVQEDLARRAKADRRAELLDVLRQRCKRLNAVPESVPSASEGTRRDAAEHFKQSLSSTERSVLAEVRAALRKSFEADRAKFWVRSAAESRLRTDTDSAEACSQLGPRECHRALERSWQKQRGGDVLLSVRLGDSLDSWDPFDGHSCPCDPSADLVRRAQGLGPDPRPCTSCALYVDGGARGSLVLFGALMGGLRWPSGRG